MFSSLVFTLVTRWQVQFFEYSGNANPNINHSGMPKSFFWNTIFSHCLPGGGSEFEFSISLMRT